MTESPENYASWSEQGRLGQREVVWEEARYEEQMLEEHAGNPLIEALPPVFGTKEIVNLLSRRRKATDRERHLPEVMREHVALWILDVLRPFSHHVTLYRKVCLAMRAGYVRRNPWKYPEPTSDDLKAFQVGLKARSASSAGAAPGQGREPFSEEDLSGFERAKARSVVRARGEALGFALIGPAGVGKTAAMEATLLTYPSVIIHRNHRGKPFHRIQIPCIVLTCPPKGGTKALCLGFFAAVDRLVPGANAEALYGTSRDSEAQMALGMAVLVKLYSIGLFVIDEIHNLRQAKGRGIDEMMSFLTDLSMVMHLPVVVIGTDDANDVLASALRQARRSAGLGMPVFGRLPAGGEFAGVCRSLWEALVLRDAPPLDDAMIDYLHRRSQGIVDVLVKLLIAAQGNALALGIETIDEALLDAAYDANLVMLHGVLNEIRACESPPSHKGRPVRPKPKSAPDPARAGEPREAARKQKPKSAPSQVPLRRIILEGHEKEKDAYQSLKEAGLIWEAASHEAPSEAPAP